MLHQNMKFAGTYQQRETSARMGCVTCKSVTKHVVMRIRDGKNSCTRYACLECGRVTERRGAIA